METIKNQVRKLKEQGGTDADLLILLTEKMSEVEEMDYKTKIDEYKTECKEKFDELESEIEEIGKEKEVSYEKFTTDVAMKLAINIADVQKGKDGEDYVLTENDKKEIASKIEVPIVEKVVETIEVRQPIVTNEIKEVAKYESTEEILNKINSTSQTIDKNVIIGLIDELNSIRESISLIPRGGARKIPIIKRIDLSTQLDGVTKTFNLPKDTVEVLGVFGTQFPVNFNPGVDWTFSGTTLTLPDHIGAPEAGQALYCLIETLFYGKI
jgi:hypothetical protein